MPAVLIDTGPVVAYLNRKDAYHEWALEQFSRLRTPYLTCEAVCVEAAHLLLKQRLDPQAVLELLRLGVLTIDFSMQDEREALHALLGKYRDQQMDLADACLVRMSELMPDSTVFTIDGDFRVYRRHQREVIPVVMPG